MTPRIGIGVPVFNGEEYLEECLTSIAGQDLDSLEVLISDNASTDGTEEIGRNAAASDPRIRYVRQAENLGAAANYNFVMHHSAGEFYKMAAHDDLLGPGLLDRCIAELTDHPEAVLAFPRTRYIGPTGEVIGDYEDPLVWTHAATPAGRLRDLFVEEQRSYLRLCYPVMGVMRRTAAQATRGIQSFQAADAAMLVELALLGDFREVDQPLYLKRLHPNTSMRANVTPQEFALWYDPRSGSKAPLPVTRFATSNALAPFRAPLPPLERARASWQVARWVMAERRFRIAGSELRAAVRTRLRRPSEVKA